MQVHVLAIVLLRIQCLFKLIFRFIFSNISSDGHSGATSAATFLVAVAAAPLLFFVTSDERQRRCFLTEKAAALQRCFLSKFSTAAATPNKLFPRLF